VLIHQYRALVGDLTYGLVCARAPELSKGDPSRQLDLMRDAILKGNDAILVSERPATLTGWAGREILGRAPAYSIRARLFVWPDRTLNLSVIGSEGDLSSLNVESFFASAACLEE
jgi:hypothetical protein